MAQYQHVVDTLRDPFPEIARMLIDAQPDPTAFATTRPPGSTGPRSGRSNPIERLNRETRRRADAASCRGRPDPRWRPGPAPRRRGVLLRTAPNGTRTA